MYKIIGADQKQYGPVPAEQLQQWIADGRANGLSLVQPEGAVEWRALAEFPEFADTLARVAAARAAAPAIMSAPPPQVTTNGMAVTGLAMGICSLTIGLCCCSGFPFSITGIIFSIIGLSQIKSNPERYTGRGMAVAGLVLSIIGICVGIVFVLVSGFGHFGEIMKELEK